MENSRTNGAQYDQDWLGFRDGRVSPKSLGEFDVITLANAGPIDILHLRHDAVFDSALHSHAWDSLHLVIRGTVSEIYAGKQRIGKPGSLLFYQQHVAHQTLVTLSTAQIVHFPIWHDPIRVQEKVKLNSPAEASLISDFHYLAVLRLFISALRDDSSGRSLSGAGSEIHDSLSRWKRTASLKSDLFIDRSGSFNRLPCKGGLSRGHFARVFRRNTDCSVGQWQQKMMIARVAQQILAGTKSLSEIAIQVGYADQSHMGRYFRKEIGISPGRFRNLTTEFLVGRR